MNFKTFMIPLAIIHYSQNNSKILQMTFWDIISKHEWLHCFSFFSYSYACLKDYNLELRSTLWSPGFIPSLLPEKMALELMDLLTLIMKKLLANKYVWPCKLFKQCIWQSSAIVNLGLCRPYMTLIALVRCHVPSSSVLIPQVPTAFMISWRTNYSSPNALVSSRNCHSSMLSANSCWECATWYQALNLQGFTLRATFTISYMKWLCRCWAPVACLIVLVITSFIKGLVCQQ